MADRRAAIAFYGLLFSVTLWPTAGQSAVFSAGDLLVGGRPGYLFQGGTAYIEDYSPSGVFQQHAALIDNGHPRDMLMVGGDVVIADGQILTRLSSNGALTLAVPVVFENFTDSLAADKEGDIYVGDLLGVVRLTKISPSGSVLARFAVPFEQNDLTALDLQPDQCTMFYGSAGSHVQQYDVCKGISLPNFAVLPAGTVTDLRILANGNVVAASTSGITVFDATGKALRTFLSNESILSIAMLPDEQAAWVSLGISPTGTRTYLIEKVDLLTGNVIAGPVDIQIPNRPEFSADALLVAGTLRVAQRSAETVAVPSLSTPLLLLMLITIAVTAIRRLS